MVDAHEHKRQCGVDWHITIDGAPCKLQAIHPKIVPSRNTTHCKTLIALAPFGTPRQLAKAADFPIKIGQPREDSR